MVAFSVTAIAPTWSVADAFDAGGLSYTALSIGLRPLDVRVLRA